jgi:hypothetical protein
MVDKVAESPKAVCKIVEAWYDYRQGQAEKALKKPGF